MNRHKRLRALVLALALAWVLAPAALGQTAAMTVHYSREGAVFTLYRVAEPAAGGGWLAAAEFEGCPCALPGAQAPSSAWRDAALALAGWVAQQAPSPAACTAVQAGRAVFEGLSPGLYLALGSPVETEAGPMVPQPVLAALTGDPQAWVKEEPGLEPQPEPEPEPETPVLPAVPGGLPATGQPWWPVAALAAAGLALLAAGGRGRRG